MSFHSVKKVNLPPFIKVSGRLSNILQNILCLSLRYSAAIRKINFGI
jgi:hypothetical protein